MFELLNVTHPTARKSHICETCGRTIEPGERYRYQSALEVDFGFTTWKQCADCDALFSIVYDWAGQPFDEGIGEDQYVEWARDPATEQTDHADAAREFLARRARHATR